VDEFGPRRLVYGMVIALGLAGGAGTEAPSAVARSVAHAASAAAAGSGLPPGVPVPPTEVTQLVTVLVPSASSTSGVLRGCRRESVGQ